MSKELDTFDKWWMMQSKIPYRDKKEIARSAWNHCRQHDMQMAIDVIGELTEHKSPVPEHPFYIFKDEAEEAIRERFSDE